MAIRNYVLSFIIFAVAAKVAMALELDHRYPNDQPDIVHTTLQRSHQIQQRDEPTRTVDLNSMPSCGVENCIKPCNTGYFSSCIVKGEDCSKVDADCYCKLAVPYKRAFHPCGWTDVIRLENWFNKTCPDIDPSINYDFEVDSVRKYVPTCARDCLFAQTISYGCTSESKNCFCSHGYLYGCTARCSESDNSTIADWLAASCQITIEKAQKTVLDDQSGDSSEKGGGPKPPASPQKLSWYEILPMVVLGASILAFLIFVVGSEWRKSSPVTIFHSLRGNADKDGKHHTN